MIYISCKQTLVYVIMQDIISYKAVIELIAVLQLHAAPPASLCLPEIQAKSLYFRIFLTLSFCFLKSALNKELCSFILNLYTMH